MSSGVGNLRIFTDKTENTKNIELLIGSTRYRAIESIIELGLHVHEIPEKRKRLANIAIKTITERRKKHKLYLYSDRSFDKMLQWIDNFLAILRGNFMDVYLVKIEAEGIVEKYNWGNSMASYDPKRAANLYLNRTVSLFSSWFAEYCTNTEINYRS
jgi:hypothetical protein